MPIKANRSGSALLIILGCVALLTILVTAFLITAGTEFTTSNFYAKGVTTKLLSENVINLVMAQLREGARSTDVNTSAPVAWASQPGMIRTYDNTGNPYKYFKLYSDDNMIGSGSFDETAQQIPTGSSGWSSKPNGYVDLNEPVNGTYPILDPAAEGSVEGFSYAAQTDTTNPLPMPVKWLYVLKDGTITVGTSSGAGTAVTITGAKTSNPVIGRVAFWSDDETCKVNINTASEGSFWDLPVASNSEELGNPNETAPYGYSTSVPSNEEFQRMPGHPATTSLSAVFGYGTNPVLPDTGLDANGPVYPLTPGTTGTYATTFGPYFSLTPRYASGGSMGGAQPAYGANPANQLPFILPAYRLYDSVDELIFDPARQPLSAANLALYPATIGNTSTGIVPNGRMAVGTSPQIIEQRRFFITAHSRAPEETLFGTPRISLWPLQAQTEARTAKDNLLAFCSTINGNPYYFQRATYFQYLPFGAASPTSTLDAYGNPGNSSQSATQDFPDAPTSTLVSPGVGNVARNENLYAYLQALTNSDRTIPGFGGDFLDKYPGAGGTSDRDEILTEMFDLIRSGVNTLNISPNVFPNYTFTPYGANAGFGAGCGSTVPIAISSNGSSTPNTHGLGRTYGVAEVALCFMASDIDLNDGKIHGTETAPIPLTAAGSPDPTGGSNRISIGAGLPWACAIDYPNAITSPPQFLSWDTGTDTYSSYYQKGGVLYSPSTNAPMPMGSTVTIGDPQTTAVQAFLMIRPYCLLTGVPMVAPKIRIRVTNLDQLTITTKISHTQTKTTNLGFPPAGSAVADYNSFDYLSEYTSGGLLETWMPNGNFPWGGPAHQFGLNDGTVGTSTSGNYPFYGSSTPILPAYPSPFGGEDTDPWLTSSTASPVPNNNVPPPPPKQIHDLAVNTGSSDRSVSNFAPTTMTLNGTTLKVDVFDGQTPSIAEAALLQTLYINIPNMTLPVPSIEMDYGEPDACESAAAGSAGGLNLAGPRIPGYGGTPWGSPPASSFQYPSSATPDTNQTYTYGALNYYWQAAFDPRVLAQRSRSESYNSGTGNIIYRGDVVRSFVLNPNGPSGGDMRLLAANPFQNQNTATGSASDLFAPLGSAKGSYPDPTQGPYTSPFIRQLHSLISDNGDGRTLLGLLQTGLQPTSVLTNPNLQGGALPAGTTALPYGYMAARGLGDSYGGVFSTGMGQVNGALFPNENFAGASAPMVTPELTGAFMDGANGTIPGDWTDGLGPSGDGPFVMKPDEAAQGDNGGTFSNNYFQSNQNVDKSATSFSPNRQVPSPLIFGTLPSRAIQGVPWCTLLFCPNPAANDANKVHPGFGIGSGTPGPEDVPPYQTGAAPYYGGPPDHLWLDLFWMPIVEPYAISEPFSTAGKVNLNYEIVPFGYMNNAAYIHRSTALHAVMKSTRILAIPTHANDGCLSPPPLPNQTLYVWPNVKTINLTEDTPPGSNQPSFSYRYGINLQATIDDAESAFQQRFLGPAKDIFRSASEICNIFLVPQAVPGSNYFSFPGYPGQLPASPPLPALPTDATYASMQNWWSNFKLTGDNGRESPYSQIYPRLTTKSNTFQIHMRVQVLSQTTADRSTGTFDTAGGDSVVGEYRGSAIVERYLDPNQSTLPDFATAFATDQTKTVDNYVQYRVVSTHAFNP
jgi:hypothetical protein